MGWFSSGSYARLPKGSLTHLVLGLPLPAGIDCRILRNSRVGRRELPLEAANSVSLLFRVKAGRTAAHGVDLSP